MAIPANVLAEEPPVTWSRESLKRGRNRSVTVWPGGFVVSSVTLGKVEVPLATGASFTGSVTVPMVIVSFDHWLVPPTAPRSRAPVAGRPPAPSEMRAVRLPGVPFQSPFGRKRSDAVAGITIALVSPSPVRGMSTQVVPSVVYCQVPCAAVDALPVIARPAAGVPVEPPVIVSVPSV